MVSETIDNMSWSNYLLFLVESQLEDADWGRFIAQLGGCLVILWFWAPITAELNLYNNTKKQAATTAAWGQRFAASPQTTVCPENTAVAPPISKLLSSSSSSSSSSSRSSDEEAELAELYPCSTAEERERFLKGKGWNVEKASKQMEAYLEWHSHHKNITDNLKRRKRSDDEDIWNRASLTAMIARKEQDICTLPRIIRSYDNNDKNKTGGRDSDGKRILHVIPAQINDKIAKPSTYALAMALYLDQILDRDSIEQVTVLIDVRSGGGWPNIHAVRQLGFAKEVAKLLLSMFPERLHRCLLYPVPSAFKWIWNIVKPALDPKTAAKFHLLSGDVLKDSPAPIEEMTEFMSLEVANMLEEERLASFTGQD